DFLLLNGLEPAERGLDGVGVARDVREDVFADAVGDLRLGLGPLGFADEYDRRAWHDGACAVFHGTEHGTGRDLCGCAGCRAKTERNQEGNDEPRRPTRVLSHHPSSTNPDELSLAPVWATRGGPGRATWNRFHKRYGATIARTIATGKAKF